MASYCVVEVDGPGGTELIGKRLASWDDAKDIARHAMRYGRWERDTEDGEGAPPGVIRWEVYNGPHYQTLFIAEMEGTAPDVDPPWDG